MAVPSLLELADDASSLLGEIKKRQLKLATAESCTGGLIAAVLTEVPGSSDVVDRGFVTYSNDAKNAMLGVSLDLIREDGAVSEAVARAMVSGALERSIASIAVSVTGIAGPGGGSADKPVGLVHLAVQRRDKPCVHARCEFGDVGRSNVRHLSVQKAFELLHSVL